MKNNSLKSMYVIFVIGLVAAVVSCLLTGIFKSPTITEHDFNYAATYTQNGETKTIEGVYRCRFTSTGEGIDPFERYYEGVYLSDPSAGEPESHIIAKQEDMELRVVFIFTADYLMGDGDDEDIFEEPYLAVFDREGCEYQDAEMLETFDVELVSWEMPQPIENTFVFSGFVMLQTGSMLTMLLIGLLMIVAFLVFVKKDTSVPAKALDTISIVLNWVIVLAGIPFVTLVVYLVQAYEVGAHWIYQAAFCVPAVMAFSVAASVALRRKGFTKSGFVVSFVGPVTFAVLIMLEAIM